ncbi:MAG TPA: zf-HC2 domain-containing protein [Streptosporangiaceae bacterium]|jgi:hypothetical protein
MTDDAECAEIRDLIPEIAAGVAAGDERARALAHLSGCQECRRELAVTADLVDEMLTLAPSKEPPGGFESRVMTRLAPEARQRRRRPSRRTVRVVSWVAATAAVAALAAGTVWWRTAQDRQLADSYRHTLAVAHGHGLSAAPLMSAVGAETGTVFAYQGEPSWLYVTFRATLPEGHYDACLVTKDGRRYQLRPLEANPNSIAWGSTIRVQVREISTIEFARSGTTVMTARF